MDESLQLSLDTVIAAAPMLGQPLEDRSCVRNRQDVSFLKTCQEASAVPLRSPAQRDSFLVAPFDILVECIDGEKRFHIIETNGTGIGGLTNIPVGIVNTVLHNLTEMARALPGDAPLVLVAMSGMESSKHPRPNHLIHEKLLYVDALKRGLKTEGRTVRFLTMPHVNDDPGALQSDQPMVVLGYIKDFLNHLQCTADGTLTLHGRPIAAAVNDRFCLNAVKRFGNLVDMTRFIPINRCFASGADKGLVYSLLDEYARTHPTPGLPSKVRHVRADNRSALIRSVVEWVRGGARAVIKPQGTGHGHGLEFFLDPQEAIDAVVDKIDHSIRVTEHYYGAIGGAFPYTVCDFLDTCVIEGRSHPLHNHKYEIRIVVYRDGMKLHAIPSIAKISSQGYDADKMTRLSLINNISTSAEAKKREGTEFMLPLANRETLSLLTIEPGQIEILCSYCAGFMRHILDELEKTPQRFGLSRAKMQSS